MVSYEAYFVLGHLERVRRLERSKRESQSIEIVATTVIHTTDYCESIKLVPDNFVVCVQTKLFHLS